MCFTNLNSLYPCFISVSRSSIFACSPFPIVSLERNLIFWLSQNFSSKVLLSEDGQLPSGRSESNQLQEVPPQKVSRHRDETRKGDLGQFGKKRQSLEDNCVQLIIRVLIGSKSKKLLRLIKSWKLNLRWAMPGRSSSKEESPQIGGDPHFIRIFLL